MSVRPTPPGTSPPEERAPGEQSCRILRSHEGSAPSRRWQMTLTIERGRFSCWARVPEVHAVELLGSVAHPTEGTVRRTVDLSTLSRVHSTGCGGSAPSSRASTCWATHCLQNMELPLKIQRRSDPALLDSAASSD